MYTFDLTHEDLTVISNTEFAKVFFLTEQLFLAMFCEDSNIVIQHCEYETVNRTTFLSIALCRIDHYLIVSNVLLIQSSLFNTINIKNTCI